MTILVSHQAVPSHFTTKCGQFTITSLSQNCKNWATPINKTCSSSPGYA